ncbi:MULTISPECIES: methyl-coenzyme M reductase operon protein D [unclassified Methanoculleus]|uniref:Methyl-coenzyme M reductase operon protein D n=1 Tax=Methanoculleus palmolei TaxID=72612 RepID=A0ABD8AAY7_9EURY|nr:methyl-coenzyme M reductase operon protein D [Methanoculleus sp. UBA377]WOX56712.1 methyl-coenzyme M reductase operon protein D [Methanoculleus palmolei]
MRSLCDGFFTEFPYRFQEGRFIMKTAPTVVDYAKYGPRADTTLIGLADPPER